VAGAVLVAAASVQPVSAHQHSNGGGDPPPPPPSTSIVDPLCASDVGEVAGFGDNQIVGASNGTFQVDLCDNEGTITGNHDNQTVGTGGGASDNSGTISGSGDSQTVGTASSAQGNVGVITSSGSGNSQSVGTGAGFAPFGNNGTITGGSNNTQTVASQCAFPVGEDVPDVCEGGALNQATISGGNNNNQSVDGFGNTASATGSHNKQTVNNLTCAVNGLCFLYLEENPPFAVGNTAIANGSGNTQGVQGGGNYVAAQGNGNSQSVVGNDTAAFCGLENGVVAQGNNNSETVVNDNFGSIEVTGNGNRVTDNGECGTAEGNSVTIGSSHARSNNTVTLGTIGDPVFGDAVDIEGNNNKATVDGDLDSLDDPLSNTDVLIAAGTDGITVVCTSSTRGLVVLTASSTSATC
jgi:hypothetical protein